MKDVALSDRRLFWGCVIAWTALHMILAVLTPVSNDLLRYSSPGADTIVRPCVPASVTPPPAPARIYDYC